MRCTWWGPALFAGVLLALAMVGANAQQTQRVPVDQTATQQKALFLNNLVTSSVAARTIEESGDAAAMASLDQARNLVKQAQEKLDKGDFQPANEQLDEALRLVNSEVRRLSQRDVKEERVHEAYDRRLHSVRTFLSAYERVAQEKELSAAANAQVGEIRAAISKAEGLAREGRYGEANEILDVAYRAARGDIKQMRGGETLTRTLNFETAEEEYSYERDRNESHVMLLQFAIAEKNPPAARLKRIEALRVEATQLRENAESQAKAGEHATAIGTLIRSTETFLKAIRMSGIWIPG